MEEQVIQLTIIELISVTALGGLFGYWIPFAIWQIYKSDWATAHPIRKTYMVLGPLFLLVVMAGVFCSITR